jgi:hypothetical protein
MASAADERRGAGLRMLGTDWVMGAVSGAAGMCVVGSTEDIGSSMPESVQSAEGRNVSEGPLCYTRPSGMVDPLPLSAIDLISNAHKSIAALSYAIVNT